MINAKQMARTRGELFPRDEVAAAEAVREGGREGGREDEGREELFPRQ